MKTRILALGAAGVLALAACAPPASSGSTDEMSPTAMADGAMTHDAMAGEDSMSPQPDVTPAQTDFANPDAPDALKFKRTDLVTGETVDFSTYAGQDVFLWFWASWCPICDAETSVIKKAAPDFPPNVKIVGVAGLADPASSKKFVSDTGIDFFPNVYDDGEIWKAWGVTAQATFILINKDGESQSYTGGYGTNDLLEKVQWLADS